MVTFDTGGGAIGCWMNRRSADKKWFIENFNIPIRNLCWAHVVVIRDTATPKQMRIMVRERESSYRKAGLNFPKS